MNRSFTLLTAADLHGLDGADRFDEVLALAAEAGPAPDAALLGGDYVGVGGPPGAFSEAERARRWQPAFRLADLRERLRAAFGREVPAWFTYGSHDKNAAEGAAGFFCGPAAVGGVHLYGISFCQMRFADDAQAARPERPYDGIDPGGPFGSSAAAAAARFAAWEASLDDRAPVFVMSHLPIHANRGDNRGGAAWCAALNRAAARRDVFLFFAHNHTAERRSPLDRRFYLAPPGGVLPVQGPEPEDRRETPIAFTYLNAGYILNGCATLLTLTGPAGGDYDTVTVRRVGDAAFGDAGVPSPYTAPLRRFD